MLPLNRQRYTRENLMVIGKGLIQEECLIHLATWGSGWVKLALSLVTRVHPAGCSCTWERWQTKLKIRVCLFPCLKLVCLYCNNGCASLCTCMFMCAQLDPVCWTLNTPLAQTGQTPPSKLNHPFSVSLFPSSFLPSIVRKQSQLSHLYLGLSTSSCTRSLSLMPWWGPDWWRTRLLTLTSTTQLSLSIVLPSFCFIAVCCFASHRSAFYFPEMSTDRV